MKKIPATPPLLIPASTLILFREDQGEIQVYLLRRSLTSGFMSGLYVFPGGWVDAGDRGERFWITQIDLTPAEINSRLGGGLDGDELIGYGVSAIRETFEEAGVLLACVKEDPATRLKDIKVRRTAGLLEPGWLNKEVVSGEWTLEFSKLFRWSHWITPRRMKRRYDTRFFLACMPKGQTCRPDDRETTHGVWISPKQGLMANTTGEIPLSPPTLVTLHQLLPFANRMDLEAAATKRVWGPPVKPRFIPMKKGGLIIEPWDPEYGQPDIRIDPERSQNSLLPATSPFSRIWSNGRIWRAVAC